MGDIGNAARMKFLQRTARLTPLPDNERAQLYTMLANLESAGIAAARALQMIASDRRVAPLASRATAAVAAVANGASIVFAAQAAGLFTASEAALVDVAARAGSPEPLYRRLAEICEDRHVHGRAMRTRLLLPAGLFTLSVLVAPLADWVTNRMSTADYVVLIIGRLLTVGVVIALVAMLLRRRRDRTDTKSLSTTVIDRLELALPVFGAMNRRKAIASYLEMLGLLLEAGTPIATAAAIASEAVPNSVIRTDLMALVAPLNAGHSLADEMRDQRCFDNECVQFINTGEQAGRLPEMVLRVARTERERGRAFDTQVARWVPRMVYFGVLLWMSKSLLG